MTRKRLAVITGVRTPFCKAGTVFKDYDADDLGAFALRETLERSGLPDHYIDEVVLGCVAQPVDKMNVARIVALKAGLPYSIPAVTVHRNCASGMESISYAWNKMLSGEIRIALVGGTESMSNIPLLFNKEAVDFFAQLQKAKTFSDRLKALFSFRPSMLNPRIGLMEGLTDPHCGMIMGLTAEVLVREFKISRQEQDEYALLSHQRAVQAQKEGKFKDEIVPVPLPPHYDTFQSDDVGPRENQSLEALAKLKPFFDKKNGTVTAGNASQVTDGACMLLVTLESKARELGLSPLGYIRDSAFAGLEPHRMGLGPAFATACLMQKSGLSLSDFQLVELNEAFASVVLANQRAFASRDFCQRELGLSEAMGELSLEKLNVNGGAIALGHPVGTTGARLVLTLLYELRRRGLQRGLATLCIGGGQGAAFCVEVE